MKICTIVGARPQFIKAAPLSKALKLNHEEIIIHTGQHFDYNMSEIFFDELLIDKPKYNLGISGGTHGNMTGRMLEKIEEILIYEKPDIVLVYGDTNSTLAGALGAAKLQIPIAHIEAGLRTGIKTNPEEINRICVDHVSSLLLTADENSVNNLLNEGITKNIFNVGDIMYDTFLSVQDTAKIDGLCKKYGVCKNDFILMTLHREENTNDETRLIKIVDFLCEIKRTILFPIHPRTLNVLKKLNLLERIQTKKNIHLLNPLSYTETVNLACASALIMTDSGGLSKESYYADSKCLFLFDADLWKDLMDIGWLIKVDFNNNLMVKDMIYFANTVQKIKLEEKQNFYGDGKTSKKIVERLEQCI